MLTKSQIFLACCLSFIIGVAVHSFRIGWSQYELMWFLAAVVSLVAVFIFWPQPRARTIFLVVLFLFLGIWRYSLVIPEISPADISFYNGQKAKIKGAVCSEPERNSGNQQFRLCSKTIIRDGEQRSVAGKILVTAEPYPAHYYGNLIILKGELQKPEPFQGFAYDRFLAKQDTYSVAYYPEITLLAQDPPLSWTETIYKELLVFKQKAKSSINKGLEEPEASLANAMFLGYKNGIPDEVRNMFSRAGLSHIIAISGLHVGILIAIIFEAMLAVGLSRNSAFYSSAVVLLGYIIMIGHPVSAVRAGFMGFLALLALKLKRLPQPRNFLIIAAFVLLMVNPRLLLDDVGFQLSFLAVGAILFFYPLIGKVLFSGNTPFIKNKMGQVVVQIIAVTCVIQLLIAPIVVYNFGVISFIAPVANLLALWTLPVVIPLLVVSILVRTIVLTIPGTAPFIFLPIKLLLGYVLWIGETLADPPLAFMEVKDIHVSWIVAYYLILLIAIFVLWHKYKSDY